MAVIFGIFLILIGLSALFEISLFKFAFAFILIALGIKILSGRGGNWGSRSVSGEDYINEVAIFSPLFLNLRSTNFSGGKVVLIFGGGEIDLREVKTTYKDIKMEIVAIFGGCKLTVPKNWKVVSEGVGIVGGYNNKVLSEMSEVTLNLRGVAIFGGVDVEN